MIHKGAKQFKCTKCVKSFSESIIGGTWLHMRCHTSASSVASFLLVVGVKIGEPVWLCIRKFQFIILLFHWIKITFSYNRGLLLFSFWKRAESDCLHTRLKGGWIVDIRCMNRRTMDIVNLICRQSLSALFQKLNNDKPLFIAQTKLQPVLACPWSATNTGALQVGPQMKWNLKWACCMYGAEPGPVISGGNYI